jgi:lysyl-tRNA synthetase, class II
MERINMVTENSRTVVEETNEFITESGRRSKGTNSTGMSLYPYSLNPVISISNIIDDFENISELDRLRVVGRVTFCRRIGNDTFLTLSDQSGEIKICLNRSYIGEQPYNRIMHVDINDILRVDGARFMTENNEMSIKADSVQILSRASRLI